MSSPQAQVDEAKVEAGIREILGPLDRILGQVSGIQNLLMLLSGPALFFVLWLLFDFRWWSALLLGFGGLVVFGGVADWWNGQLARRALPHFDRRFPPDSPERAVAERILGEMESPNKAEQKLLEALNKMSSGRIIRRRQAPPAEQQVDAALQQLNNPAGGLPPAPPVQRDPPSAKGDSRARQGQGGYYDYIPLDIPATDDKKSEHERK
jgi:hypothetical protein